MYNPECYLVSIILLCIKQYQIIFVITLITFCVSCRESIECKTPEGDEGVKSVTVSVDSFTANTQQNFKYVSDPVFTHITPDFSFIS